MNVALRNTATGRIRFQKVGWSWSGFFAAELLGIPLFLSGLYSWGALVIALWASDLLTSDLPLEQELTISLVLMLVGSGLSCFLGAKANALAGRRYLATGWEFARPNSEEAASARRAWGIERGLDDDELN
jgi:hypothetical protein